MTSAAPEKRPFGRRHAIALALIVVLILSGIFLAPLEDWIVLLRDWTADHGILGYVVFAVAYSILTFLLTPGALLMLAAGLAFGLAGFFPVLGGAVLGSVYGFVAGRYFARGRVAQLVARRPRLALLDDAVARAGWRIVLMLRLSGVIPFNIQNWAMGATRVRFLPYLAATAVGVMPGAITYVWLGAIGGAAASDPGPATWGLLGLSIVATAAMVIILSRKAHQVLTRYGVEDDGAA